MKKYRIIYVIMYLILLVLIFTKGIDIGFELYSHSDKYVIDGFNETNIVLIFNFSIIVAILIASLIITFSKNNIIKYKGIIIGILIILVLFIPVFVEHITGGEMGANKEIYKNIFMMPLEQKEIHGTLNHNEEAFYTIIKHIFDTIRNIFT